MLLTIGLGLATAGWACTYVVSIKLLTPASLKPADRIYFASSVVGILHALYTGFTASWLLFTGALPLWEGFGVASPEWERCVMISFGYFAYDAVLIAACPTMHGRGLMLLHHFLGLSMHFCPVCVYRQFAAISCVGYLAELSTPFVNARWMLKEAGGGSGTRVYLWNGVAILVSFFLCRIVAGLVYLYQIFVLVPRLAPPSLSDLGVFGRLVPPGALLFYGMNVYWMSKIVQGAAKLLVPPSRPAAKQASAEEPLSKAQGVRLLGADRS